MQAQRIIYVILKKSIYNEIFRSIQSRFLGCMNFSIIYIPGTEY